MPTDCADSQLCPPRPRPAVCSSARKTGSFGLALGSGLHGDDIGRADTEIMMNARGEQGSAQQRAQDVGQKKIGHGVELVSSGEMAGDLYAQLAQMLHRSPHLRTRGAEFFGDTLTADHHGGVVLSRRTMRLRRASVEPVAGCQLSVVSFNSVPSRSRGRTLRFANEAYSIELTTGYWLPTTASYHACRRGTRFERLHSVS